MSGVGFFLLLAVGIIISSILYAHLNNLADAILAGFIFVNAIIVGMAEALSLFSAYNLIGCNILLGGICLFLVLTYSMNIKLGCSKFGVKMKTLRKLSSFSHVFLAVAIILFCTIAIAKALSYPPQNYDSMTYHLPRSFLYWKNESIHNMPYTHKWALYTGPFNAILMTQLRIFTEGSDYLLNLIQMPAWIMASIAAGKITILFCEICGFKKEKTYAGISVLLVLTVPIALFQASTTQCDLLVASFSIIAVYFMLKSIFHNKYVYLFSAGFAGGLTLLTKVTGGFVLLAIGIYFIIYFFLKHKLIKTILTLFMIGMSGLSITIGFWIRNAIDLKGDFLAIGISNNIGSDIWQPVMTKILLNLGYLFGSGNTEWAECINRVIGHIHDAIVPGFSISSIHFNSLGQWYSHDYYPYGIHMVIIFVSILAAILLSLKKKKYSVTMYALVCFLIFLGTASSFLYTESSSRYMLGALFITIPLVSWNIVVLSHYLYKKYVLNAILTLLALLLVGSGIRVQLNDYYMPFPKIKANKTYDELRTAPYAYLWDKPRDDFIRIIEEENCYSIGFYDEIILGEYPILYELRDEKYTVQFVNAQYGGKYEKEDFSPDCIVYAGKPGTLTETIMYNGKEYTALTEFYEIIYGSVVLYGKM